MSSPSRLSAIQSTPAATATTTTTSFDTTTKKKFGKNLNKLTAPPVIPVVQGNNKSSSSSKNGFLLLSTKRNISGSSAATASGGILSSKSVQNTAKPIPNLGLHTELTSSTHDALLGVVVGASRLESQQQPDAWGVAEKQEQSQNTRIQKNKEHAAFVPLVSAETTPRENNTATSKKNTENISINGKSEHNLTQDEERSNPDSVNDEFRTSNWDEYGGRHLESKDGNNLNELSGNNLSNDDEQGAFMTKLARQRAEKKRDEEQNRMLEQKERAAQRLRELEEKMTMKKKEITPAKSAKGVNTFDKYNAESKIQSRIVLEKLKQKDSATVPLSTTPGRTQRTLYDPNIPGKSYSSLVAGPLPEKLEKSSNVFEQSTKSQQLLLTAFRKNGAPSQQGTYSADPESFDRQSVIQLACYEDRNRGDRNTSAAPRMLFDPKSGSMIEVTSREEGATSGRNRKIGKKNKNSRDKHSKKDLPTDSNNIDSKGRRKFKGAKEANHRLKGVSGESSTSKQEKRLKIADPRKIPRTCGVLYSRDKKGVVFCTDGCEGDLGYGVHSVPGGRVKNSEAYSKYIDCQKQIKEEAILNYDAINHNDVILETGFHISDVRHPKHEWIRPNEKIELITGDEDSPTLQATAREWAPSHTPFTLSERDKMTLSSTGSLDEDEDEDEELAEDHDAPLGLGFDPASNMDSVMQSPSIEPSDGLRTVDLTSLSLEPVLKGPAKNSHIFAFESGATWGASNSEGSNDWGAHSGNTYGSGATKSESVSTSFLSLSAGNTWGGFVNSLNGENSKSSGE